jgi:hypothetical protein
MQAMFNLRQFIVRSHEKIIDHYLRLLRTSQSEEDEAFYRAAMQRHEEELDRIVEETVLPLRRAA